MPHTEPQDITVKYQVPGDAEVLKKEEEDDWTLQQFKAWVTNWHQLQGVVTIHQGNRQLTSLNTSVGEIFKRNKNPLIVKVDGSFATAAGGYGEASSAYSKNGAAYANGGRGDGGRVDTKGKHRGGDGTGGDSQGDTATGGRGLGGGASNPNGGAVKSGRSTGGTGTQNKAKAGGLKGLLGLK